VPGTEIVVTNAKNYASNASILKMLSTFPAKSQSGSHCLATTISWLSAMRLPQDSCQSVKGYVKNFYPVAINAPSLVMSIVKSYSLQNKKRDTLPPASTG